MTFGATFSLCIASVVLLLIQVVHGKSDEYYRDKKIQRRENCYDCFNAREAMLCEVYFDRCMLLDRSSDASEKANAKSEAVRLIKELENESKLRDDQRSSGYCLNFQDRIADLDNFCEFEYGEKTKMLASYIAMVVSQAILKEYDAKRVDTLIVDVQHDKRSEKQYEKYLMDKLYSSGIIPAVSTTNSKMYKNLTVGLPPVGRKVGANGYRTWSIHVARKPGKNAPKFVIQRAVDKAILKYGKSYYISKQRRVVKETKKFFIVRIKVKR